MIRLLIAFIVLLAAVYLGIQLHYDPGYILIAINHWTVETTVWVGIFGLLFLFLFLYASLRLLHKLASTPGAISRWHSRHLAQKAQETTRRGLIEYSEGYWLKAKNHLIQALPNADTPLLNYLTAARAAQKMGDSQLRDHYLREAQQSMPEAKIAVELTQAQLQLANHQWEQALATLRHLQDLAPKHPYVLKLLMHLYEEIRDWNQLIALLPELKRNKVISEAEFSAIEHKAYLQAIAELAKQHQNLALENFMASLPKKLQLDPALISEYVRFLYLQAEYTKAEALLRKALRKEFNTQLIDLYGLLPGSEDQLIFAESLSKKFQHSASLHLCLGRLCLAQQLWGRAKTHLEQAMAIDPQPTTLFELGCLQERLEDPSLACAFYKKGLELAIGDKKSLSNAG